MLSTTQTLLSGGVDENAEETVIVVPEIESIVFVSRVPSDKITDKVLSPSIVRSVLLESSIIICVVDTPVFILPPLLTPALKGSAIFITCPHLTSVPASNVVVKLTTSLSLDCV